MPAKHTTPLAERFWALVQRGSDCWLWSGRLNEHGYGVIDRGGHSRHGGRPVLAHRLAYELARGPIADGLFVCHRCDTPACVNPAHLWLGTNADNMRDMTAKGRGNQGERCYIARLTDAQVVAIRYRYAHGLASQRAMCAEFGVHPSTLCDLIKGRTWKHLPLYPDQPS